MTQAGSNNDLDYKIFSENMQFWSHISSLNILYITIYINWSWKLFVVPINLLSKLFQFLIFSEYTIILSTPPLFHSSCVFRFSNSIVNRENTRACVSFAFQFDSLIMFSKWNHVTCAPIERFWSYDKRMK